MVTETLDSVVRDYMLMGEGKESLHGYSRYLQAAIRGLKDMHYDVSGVPQVAVREVEDGGRITLPEDTIRIVRMGYLDATGRFIEFYVDNTLVVNAQGPMNCSGDTNTLQYSDVGIPIAPTPADMTSMMRNGQIIGRQYGTVGGSIYTYRVDWAQGVVELSSNICGQVIIEYLGDPQKVNGQYAVHPFLVEPLQAYMNYAINRFKKSVAPGEKDYAFRQYVLKKSHAHQRFVSESIGNIINKSRTTFSQTVKF
jgi:hypothetical protein